MVAAFALKPEKMTQSSVRDTVELQMEDPVWKQVLGHKAFEQFKKELDERQVSSSTSTSSASSSTSSSVSSSLRTTKATTTAPSMVVSTAAVTAAPTETITLSSVPTAVPITAPTTTPAPSTTQGPLLFGTQGPSALDQMAQEFMDEAGKLNPESEEHKSLQSVAKMLHKMSAPAVTDQPLISSMPMTSTTNSQTKQTQALGHAAENALDSPLAPHEALQDGNRCPSDEEEFPSTKGNCYKKCADLTGGYYPIRTSAFSCCASEPCTFFNSKIHIGFCSGFDIAGDAEGDGCPTFEGACLVDEENFGGLCYKKCSLFPDGQTYSHRVAPNICCSTHGFMCMLPKYFKFSTDFAVGGGEGDGNSQTPAQPHPPMKELTEMDA